MPDIVNQEIQLLVDEAILAIQNGLLGLPIGQKSMSEEDIRQKIVQIKSTSLSLRESEFDSIVTSSLKTIFDRLDKDQQKIFYRALSLELHPDKIESKQPLLNMIIKARGRSIVVPQTILNGLMISAQQEDESFFTNPMVAILTTKRNVDDHIQSKLKKWFFPLNKMLNFFFLALNYTMYAYLVPVGLSYLLLNLLLDYLPNKIMDWVRNLISDGHFNTSRMEMIKSKCSKLDGYDDLSEIEKDQLHKFYNAAIMFFLRMPLFAKAMAHALISWPESWWGKGLHIIVKPLQLVATPILLVITFGLELIRLLVSIVTVTAAIPLILPLIVGLILAVPVYFVEMAQSLYSCLKAFFKKNEPPIIAKAAPNMPGASNVADLLPRTSVSNNVSPLMPAIPDPGHYGEPVTLRRASIGTVLPDNSDNLVAQGGLGCAPGSTADALD